MSKKSHQEHIQKNFVQVGKVMVDPNNVLAVKIARIEPQGVVFSHKPSDEREAVEAAHAKRERKRLKETERQAKLKLRIK